MKKVAIVTGASGNGIGRSTALTLARDGFDVVINYRSNKENAERICKAINEIGGNAISIEANIFTSQGCELLVNEAVFTFGRLDACVIGPGADWNPEPPDKIVPERSLQDVVQEISPIYSFLPRIITELKKNKSGRIIAIASNPRLPSPSYSYNAAKQARIAAIMGLTESCWKEKITVNVVAPGPVDHIDGLASAVEQLGQFPTEGKKISPQDIAEIISYLCSEKGRFVTGNVIGTYF